MRALALTAALLALVAASGGCRNIASYEGAAVPDSAAPDLESPAEASVTPLDAGQADDLAADLSPDTWPQLTPGNCAGPWWIPPPTLLNQAKEATVLALPKGGWLVAWVDAGDKVFFRRLDEYGAPVENGAEAVPTGGEPAMLALGLSNGEPLLAWSEQIDSTGSGSGPSCERRLAFRYLDSGATCDYQAGGVGQSLVEPAIHSGMNEAHLTAALIWNCALLPSTRHSKAVPLRVVPPAVHGADCTVEDQSPIYIGLTESYRPRLFAQPSGGRALSLLQQRQNGLATGVDLDLRLYPASLDPAHVLDVGSPISLGMQASDGRYDAIVHDGRLWVAWERASPASTIAVSLVDSATTATPPWHATISDASDPALFSPTNYNVPSIVHCDLEGTSATHGLVVRRLPGATTDGPPGPAQLIRAESSKPLRKPRAPKVAAQQDSVGVVWLEGSGQTPQLYFTPLFCQPST